MRLTTARKLAAHASVGCAFASITTGGDIPLPVMVAFLILLVIAFFLGERIGKGRGGLFTVLSGLTLVVLVGLTVAGVFDLVVSAALFAASLAVNRLYSRQSAADDGLLYLSALMMLAGGAALSAELLYGVCFACFTFCTTAALTLSHLSRAVEEGGITQGRADALVAGRLMGGLFALSAVALLGSTAVFFLFPRFTAGIAMRTHPRVTQPTTGFSDTVQLGGHGTLKSNSKIMLRVKPLPVDGRPDPLLTPQLDLLWKGRTFDVYDGKGWRSNPAREGASGRVDTGAGPADAGFELEVLPSVGTNVVFVTGTPTLLERPRRQPPGPLSQPALFFVQDSNGNLKLRPAPDEGFTYVLHSVLAADERKLRGLGAQYPDEIKERYLQLPEGLDPRIAALAAKLTAGKSDPYEKAKAIEKELGKLSYTTELPGDVPDPLAHFLFERKQGHCEYFSTAYAVLLRAAGVPSRNATGFFGGRKVRGEPYFVLRGGDAHSWTEIYFPGKGFVAFDATPPDGRNSNINELVDLFQETVDRLSTHWRSLVVEYSLNDQYRGVVGALQTLSRGFDRLRGRSGEGASLPLRLLAAAVVLGFSLLLARWLWITAGTAPQQVEQRAREAVGLYRTLLGRLQKRGLKKRAAQTPREFVAELEQAMRPEAPTAAAITERYLAVRFGDAVIAREELAALKKRVREL